LPEQTKKSKKKHLSVIARIAVAILAVGWFLKTSNPEELWDTLMDIDPLIFAAAVGLYMAGQFLFVMRWRLLLKVLSIDLGLLPAFKLHLLGLFYNNCLPSTVGGDFLRAWYVTRHAPEEKRFEAALSVFVDRAVGLCGMLLMAAGFYWLVPVGDTLASQGSAEPSPADQGGGFIQMLTEHKYILLTIAVAVVMCFVAVALTARGRSAIKKIWAKLWAFGLRLLGESIAAAKIYCKRPLAIIGALILTFCCQSLTILGFYLIGRNLDVGAPMKYYFVFFPLSWLIGVLPISIGGLGIVEGWLKFAFLQIPGVNAVPAAAIAVCQRLIMLIGSVPGVFVHIFGAHLPSRTEEFFVDSDENMD
jgi:hypothetical protein